MRQPVAICSTPDFHPTRVRRSIGTPDAARIERILAIKSGSIRIAEIVIARLKYFSSFARPQDLPSDSKTGDNSWVAATCAKFFPV